MSQETTNCSVVIVSYNTGPVLFACLKSVLRQHNLADLILVDNGNPPEVVTRLQQMKLTDPRLKIITGQGNVGFARGCNMGAKFATGNYILLLNPDCLLPPEALDDTMQALSDYPDAVLAGCWLKNPDGSEQRGGRRQLLTPKTALAEAFCLHKIFRMKRLNEHKTEMPRETHEVPAISGAYMCMLKKDFDRMFGLDEGYFLHVEDIDLCMRVHRMGGKVICVPKVKVAHMLSTSGKVSSAFIEWHKAKGFMRYFDRHFSDRTIPGLILLIKLAVLIRFSLKMALSVVRSKKARPMTLAERRLMVLASSLIDLPETRDLSATRGIVLTGATGPVGLCILRRALAGGASVVAVTRDEPIPFAHEMLRWMQADINDKMSMTGYRADTVIHCAPLWLLPSLLDKFSEAGIKRIIAFGSTSVFGKAMSKNWYERELVSKLGNAERDLQKQCDDKGLNLTILRPTLVYGVGLDANISDVARIIKKYGFFPIYPPANGRRQPVHADDLAQVALHIMPMKTTYGKSYNLSGGEVLPYRNMVERIFNLCRRKVRIVETTMLPFMLDVLGKVTRRKGINGEMARRMNDDLVFFHDDAKRDFGFSPRPFLSGGLRDIEGF